MPLLCTQTLCFHINTENFADEPAEKFPSGILRYHSQPTLLPRDLCGKSSKEL